MNKYKYSKSNLLDFQLLITIVLVKLIWPDGILTCIVHCSLKSFFGVSCVVNTMLYFTIALLLFRVPFGPIVVYNIGSEVPTHSVSGPICPKLTALHASPFSSCCFSLSSASLCVATSYDNNICRTRWPKSCS